MAKQYLPYTTGDNFSKGLAGLGNFAGEAFTGGTGDIFQGISNMPKYWSTSGFEKSLPNWVNVARGQAPEDYASLAKSGFKATRDKLLDLGTGMGRGVFTGIGDKAQNVADWFAKPSFGKFGDWAQAATRGTGLGTPLKTTFSGYVPKDVAQISRNLWGGIQGVIPKGWANKAFNLPGGGSMARIAKSPATKVYSRLFPGANIALGAKSAYDRFNKGQYARSALAAGSMIPGPIGMGFLGAETATDYIANKRAESAANIGGQTQVGSGGGGRMARRSQPTFERPSANREFTRTDYGKSYQAGGSVNPFEEMARAGRAGRDYKRDNLPPYRASPSDNVPGTFKGPYEPDLTREPTQPWELMGSKANIPWQNSGWLEASAPRDNTGVMGSRNGKSWLANNPWFLNLMANRHGDPSQLEGLDLGGDGLFNLFGGNWGLDIEREDEGGWRAGITGTWNL